MARRKTHDRMTNVEFVTDMMEYSDCGALAQIFILDAIGKMADSVAKAPPIPDGLVNGQAWKRVAIEIRDKMNSR